MNPLTTTPALIGKVLRLNTAELFKHSNEIEILHDGNIYRLRITANGKLLLTK